MDAGGRATQEAKAEHYCIIQRCLNNGAVLISIFENPTQAVRSPLGLGVVKSVLPVTGELPHLFLVAFLRHVGCPFAERDVKKLVEWAKANPEIPVFVVSHGSQDATDQWLAKIGGAQGLIIIIDESRNLYREWGLGYSNVLHFLGLRSLLGVVRLWFFGIYNRPASGTRWQRSGIFLMENGHVSWSFIPETADEFSLPVM